MQNSRLRHPHPGSAQLLAACLSCSEHFFIYKVSCTWICRARGKLRRGQKVRERKTRVFMSSVLQGLSSEQMGDFLQYSIQTTLCVFQEERNDPEHTAECLKHLEIGPLTGQNPTEISPSPPNLHSSLHPGSLSSLCSSSPTNPPPISHFLLDTQCICVSAWASVSGAL